MKKSFKKNYVLRAAGVLLLACVLFTSAIGGAAARFTESAPITKQYVRVAAFRVLANDKVLGEVVDAATGDTLEVDLFDTLYSSVDNLSQSQNMTVKQSGDPDSLQETSDPANRPYIIAPGNGGEFIISVTNQSEVPVRYSVGLSGLANDAGIPIEFRAKDGSGWTPWIDWDDSGVAGLTGGGDLTAAGGSSSSAPGEVLFQWRWKYEEGASPETLGNARNQSDTALGVTERDHVAADAQYNEDNMFAAGDAGYQDTSQKLILTVKATAFQLD